MYIVQKISVFLLFPFDESESLGHIDHMESETRGRKMKTLLNLFGIKTKAQKRAELLKRAAWLESIGNFRKATQVYSQAMRYN